MQYACSLDRQGLASLVGRFVDALSNPDAETALGCLHDTAYFCVQTHFLTASGTDAIRSLLGAYSEQARRTDIADRQMIIDAKNGRVAVACSMRPEGGDGQANTLFFRIRDDRIQEVYLYIAGENLFA